MFLSTPNLRRLFATILPGILAAVATMATATQATVLPSAQVLASATLPFLPRAPGDDVRVAFTARMFAGTLFVTATGELVYRLRGPDASTDGKVADWAIVETFAGAVLNPRGAAAGNAMASRMLGDDPARWQLDLPAFERVELGEAWPGITIELSAHARSVEKRFVLAPGADARRIAVRLKGARRITRSGDGTLRVDTGHGPVQFGAPVAWQDIDGERRPVAVRYAVAGNRYGFALGPYDRSQAARHRPAAADDLWRRQRRRHRLRDGDRCRRRRAGGGEHAYRSIFPAPREARSQRRPAAATRSWRS